MVKLGQGAGKESNDTEGTCSRHQNIMLFHYLEYGTED